MSSKNGNDDAAILPIDVDVEYSQYQGEKQLAELVKLIDKDLSEPYSIFTYRYFLYNWPELCFLARVNQKLVGAIVCRFEQINASEHQAGTALMHNDEDDATSDGEAARGGWRGYIAMLAVEKKYRKMGIGSKLVRKAIDAMIKKDCDEVMLETEIANKGAIRLYENLGFARDERLVRYYLNGGDAFRLKLWLK